MSGLYGPADDKEGIAAIHAAPGIDDFCGMKRNEAPIGALALDKGEPAASAMRAIRRRIS